MNFFLVFHHCFCDRLALSDGRNQRAFSSFTKTDVAFDLNDEKLREVSDFEALC